MLRNDAALACTGRLFVAASSALMAKVQNVSLRRLIVVRREDMKAKLILMCLVTALLLSLLACSSAGTKELRSLIILWTTAQYSNDMPVKVFSLAAPIHRVQRGGQQQKAGPPLFFLLLSYFTS